MFPRKFISIHHGHRMDEDGDQKTKHAITYFTDVFLWISTWKFQISNLSELKIVGVKSSK